MRLDVSAQLAKLQIELSESWTLLARLCVPPLLNCPKDESIRKVSVGQAQVTDGGLNSSVWHWDAAGVN